MTIVLELYIIVCVALLLFDIGFLMLKNSKNQRLNDKDDAFKSKLYRAIQEYRDTGSYSEAFLQELAKELEKTVHLVSLQDILEEQTDIQASFRSILYDLIDVYRKKPEHEQAFYTYVISALDYSEEKPYSHFSSKFMQFLQSKSLYTFTNAMEAIYNFGEVYLMVQALDVLNQRRGFYHQKLLTDGLLTFKGDFEALNQALLQNFAGYEVHIKECLLDYFRMQGCDAKALCLHLIGEDQPDGEVKYHAMRYFQKFPCEEAKEIFLQVLQDKESGWIRQMLAIQGLQRYEDSDVYALVKQKVTCRDWYVRNNAVELLYKKGLNRTELEELLSLND
ncbi:MAG: HEAT repeat domain-containing protein, partial [Bacillota bacterium]|nr:HEAT repeat domain-containing protein [Bacillota bacterium]